jgi:hypothetical protein
MPKTVIKCCDGTEVDVSKMTVEQAIERLKELASKIDCPCQIQSERVRGEISIVEFIGQVKEPRGLKLNAKMRELREEGYERIPWYEPDAGIEGQLFGLPPKSFSFTTIGGQLRDLIWKDKQGTMRRMEAYKTEEGDWSDDPLGIYTYRSRAEGAPPISQWEEQFKTPIDVHEELMRVMEKEGIDVGSDAYYDDPNNFTSVIVRGPMSDIKRARLLARKYNAETYFLGTFPRRPEEAP